MTHICVNKLTNTGSDNGLSLGWRQAITRTNAGILLIGPLGTNFSEILIEIHTFSFKKMHLKILSGKCRPFCLGLNVLMPCAIIHKEVDYYEGIRQYDSCNTGELDRHAQHQQPCLASRTPRVIARQEQPVLSGTHWSSFAHRQMSVVLCLRRFPMKIENCHIRHQRPLKIQQRPPR